MAACFKLPSLAKRPRPPSHFPEFKWSEVRVQAELGCCAFGSVYLVKIWERRPSKCYFKKNERRVDRSKKSIWKEAGILNSVKDHRNASELLRFCKEPYAIMMEHACFDFTPFGVDKKVNSLEDFYILLMGNSTLRRSQMFCYYVQGMLLSDFTFFTWTTSPTET